MAASACNKPWGHLLTKLTNPKLSVHSFATTSCKEADMHECRVQFYSNELCVAGTPILDGTETPQIISLRKSLVT